MKLRNKAIKYGAIASTATTALLVSAQSNAAADAAITAVTDTAIGAAGDTAKAVVIALIGAAVAVMAATWAYRKVRG